MYKSNTKTVQRCPKGMQTKIVVFEKKKKKNEHHISTEQYKYSPWAYVLKILKWIFSQMYTFFCLDTS